MAGQKIDALKLENQLCFPLYAAARKITAAYTPILKPVSYTHLDVYKRQIQTLRLKHFQILSLT